VALKEKYRSSIYRKLVPVLGEEETEAMLAHFPARDVEEPVTKADLAITEANLRTEIERSAKRTVLWLSGVIIAVGSLMVAAGALLLNALR
jgi:hypothetical protein